MPREASSDELLKSEDTCYLNHDICVFVLKVPFHKHLQVLHLLWGYHVILGIYWAAWRGALGSGLKEFIKI